MARNRERIDKIALAMVNASRAVGDFPPLERIDQLPDLDAEAYRREAKAAMDEMMKGE